jgi:hypothetical protein
MLRGVEEVDRLSDKFRTSIPLSFPPPPSLLGCSWCIPVIQGHPVQQCSVHCVSRQLIVMAGGGGEVHF